MNRLFSVIVLITFSFLFKTPGISSPVTTDKNILVLFSYDPTTPAYKAILEGIRESLTKEFSDSYNLHIEYLGIGHYPKNAYPKENFEVFNKKFVDIDLDLLICVGPEIVSALQKNADNYILNLPTVSLDFDFSKYGVPPKLALNRHTAEIKVKIDFQRTITEALKIFPRTESIYFIGGVSYLDSLLNEVSKADADIISDSISKTFIFNKSMNEILHIAGNLPDNSLIMITSISTDAKNVPYYNPESVGLISRAAKVPVFTFTDMGFGEGSFGGEILSFKKTGIITGETAVKILKGSEPSSFINSQTDCYDYLLDYRQLKLWDMTDLEKMINGSTVLFKEITFFGKYMWILIFGILFMILQSFLISALVKMYYNQKKMAKKILDAEKKYTKILHEERIMRTGILTASLSHELKQPLTAILSTAQAGLNFIKKDNTEKELLKNIFNNIVEDNKRAASILGTIRGMMKLEKREKEKTDLNNLIMEVAELYRSRAMELNCRIRLQLPDEHIFVFADPIQIQQVILNLLTNAAQSTNTSGTNINIVTVTEVMEAEIVSVSVQDHGSGIDESVKDKLFEPFITSKKEGSGIGLSITNLIITDHKGTISARNMPDGGAEFTFYLKVYNESVS